MQRDVVIVGGGHNGLTAAAYLAQAGLSVTVLERLDALGGAAVSAQAFGGLDAQLSRYSYLVSLMPQRIIDDLRLQVRLIRRRHSSYTPEPGTDRGLLIDRADPAATAAALGADASAWDEFYAGTGALARSLFPTMTEPLPTRAEARSRLGDETLWRNLIEQPIGTTIAETFRGDLVRGVVLTDALIGTFAPNVDETLAANRCFVYHVIGGGTGDWDLPVGGMGAVSGELARAARFAGARLVTGAEVISVTPDGEVVYRHDEEDHRLQARWVLSNAAPAVLEGLLGAVVPGAGRAARGAQVKTNLLLSRLPRLREPGLDPAAAFGGTFHINELWSQLDAAHQSAASGRVPDPLPCEIYCHSLSDPSILGQQLAASGAHTLTVFGLHVPHGLPASRDELQDAVLASLNSVLAEPVEQLLLPDAHGAPAIETKTTADLEQSLAMPGGNIFHGGLDWPFAEDEEPLSTPAQRWGVATAHPRILLCGSGARRGGGVSGIGGHNAAMAVLESL